MKPPGPAFAERSVVEMATGRAVPLEAAHSGQGICHLAVSAQLQRDDGLWLLQRRATAKVTFGGFWANSCCTHPFPGESTEAAIARRIEVELGIVAYELEFAGSFSYAARDPSSPWIEHEHDHVFVGRFSGDPRPDPMEVGAVWLGHADDARAVLDEQPAPWAHQVLDAAFAPRAESPAACHGDRCVGPQDARRASTSRIRDVVRPGTPEAPR